MFACRAEKGHEAFGNSDCGPGICNVVGVLLYGFGERRCGNPQTKKQPHGAAREDKVGLQYVNIRSCSSDSRTRTLGIAISHGLPSMSSAVTPLALEDMPDR